MPTMHVAAGPTQPNTGSKQPFGQVHVRVRLLAVGKHVHAPTKHVLGKSELSAQHLLSLMSPCVSRHSEAAHAASTAGRVSGRASTTAASVRRVSGDVFRPESSMVHAAPHTVPSENSTIRSKVGCCMARPRTAGLLACGTMAASEITRDPR